MNNTLLSNVGVSANSSIIIDTLNLWISLLSTVLFILLVDLWYLFMYHHLFLIQFTFQLSDKYDIMEREFNSLKVFLNCQTYAQCDNAVISGGI